jgi:uncharacterized repeat protein (TIGR02543 family)
MMVATTVVTAETAHALTTCAIGSSAQNSIAVEPSQPTVMYIDSGVSPRIDASYVGYRITNSTGAPIEGYWASIDNFTGGVIGLANPLDKFVEVPDLAIGASTTVYFLLKANAATKVVQSHDFKIFDKRPDASTASNKYGCTFGFTKVAETIKASANKLDSGYPSVPNAPGDLGTTFTVIAKGASGTIGAGSADVGKILWFTPTAYSNFPTRAFRLESVELHVADNNGMATNGSNKLWAYKNRLFVKTTTIPDTGLVAGSQSTADPLDNKRYYENTYTFRVIGKASGSVAPIAQISSGTQIKHQATVATAAVNSTGSAVPVTISKTVDTTTANMGNLPKVTISGSQYIEVPYKVTLANSAATSIRVDQVVDTPARNSIYKTGSSSIKIGAATAIGLANPETLTAESALNPMPLHFFGPFDVPANNSVVIYYKIYIPAVQGTYSNSALAYVGDYQITSSTAASIPSVNVTVNSSGNATTYETKTVTLLPEGVTLAATSIDTSTGTINGTVDPNGDTATTGIFEWGTSSTLVNPATIDVGGATGTDPVSKSSVLTGLSPNTTYYYRIVALSRGVRYPGQILSFTTLVQKAAPTVTTDPPTAISSSNATLNATVSANLNSVSIQFLIWKTNDTKTVLVVDDPTTAFSTSPSSPNPYTVFSGGFSSGISINMTDGAYSTINSSPFLVANATYYYIAQIVDSANTASILATGVTRTFSLRTYVDQTIMFNAISNITWGDAAPTISPTASSTLSVTRTSNTPSVCTIDGSGIIVIVGVGTCSISANQSGGPSGGNYYNPAPEVTQSFDVLPKQITVTAVAKTKQYGDNDPALTYSVSGTLVGSDTFTGTISRTAGQTLGTYAINQNTLALSSNYSLIYNSANLTITPRLITITAAAKSKAYGDNDPALTYSLTSGSLAVGDNFSGALTREPGTNVGSYLIDSGTVTVNANYTITYVGANLTITKKTLTVTVENKTKRTADADPTFTYSITSGALVGSDALSGTPARPNTSSSAGSYSIETGTVTVSNIGNYNFNVIAGTLTITDKTIPTLYWPSPASIVYGTLLSGTQLNAEARDSSSSLPGTCVYDPALGEKLSVGPHTLSVICTPTDSSVYSAVSGTVTITVTGKPITVKADAKNKQYGDLDPSLSSQITSGSLVSGDSLSGALARNAGENVGLYSITQGTIDNANYIITFIGDTLTVSAIQLTVIITAPDKQYDRDVDTELTIGSLSGVISADSGLVTIDATKVSGIFATATAANGKTVTLAIASGILAGSKSGNYTLATPSNPTANITKAPATVTAANKTVTAGASLTSISYSVSGIIAGDPTDPFTGISCLSNYDRTTDDSATARYTRCSGGLAANYVASYVDGTVTIVDASTSTYAVTYTAGAGTGTPPTESNKTSGEVFNLASGSSLTRSGYTFTGWSCDSASTQSAGSSFTMPAAVVTCIAQWSANTSGGGSGNSNTNNSNANTPVKKTLVVSLVTISIVPVKANASEANSKPAPTPSATPSATPKATPAPTPSATPKATPAPTPAASPSPTSSSNGNPGNGGNSGNAGGSNSSKTEELNNVKLSETTVIPTKDTKQITFSGTGISKVTVVGTEVSVQARTGFSGATTVKIVLKNDDQVSNITAEVLVLPQPPVDPVATVSGKNETRILWNRSPNAISYEVTQGDEVLCATTSTNCVIPRALKSTPQIQIKSLGKSKTISPAVPATYKTVIIPETIPEIALVINFDTNKYNLDAQDKAKIEAFAADVVLYGYKKIDISGHTDSKGGVDNNVLSLNRAKASRDYLLSLVPGLSVTINGYAFAVNVASNATATGMAANRRAEFRVVG